MKKVIEKIKFFLSLKDEKKHPNKYVRASSLIASASYTRGLWTPFIIWRRFSSPPFFGKCPQWGVDEEFIHHHYLLALYYAILFSVSEIFLLLLYSLYENFLLGFLFISIVIIQWFLFPWIKACSILAIDNAQAIDNSKCHIMSKEIITGENDIIIDDLGYLIREAIFSIDTTKKLDFGTDNNKDVINIKLDDFFSTIENEIKKVENCESTICKVKTINYINAQPKSFFWGNTNVNSDNLKMDNNSGKILILSQDDEHDGLATAEIGIKKMTPHFSFHLRLRWLPPIKKRYKNLLLLSRQHTWWQFFMSLVLLSIFIFIKSLLIPFIVNNDINPLYGYVMPSNDIGLIVILISAAIFTPVALFFIVLLRRAIRYVRCVICIAAGITFKFDSPESFLFAAAEADIKADEDLYNGIFYMHLFEEIILNKIVSVLKEYDVDTDSIKQEFRNFQNDGIYVTGGNIQANNIAVGRFISKSSRYKRKSSRKGGASLLKS